MIFVAAEFQQKNENENYVSFWEDPAFCISFAESRMKISYFTGLYIPGP
jgi:hypothetical protein